MNSRSETRETARGGMNSWSEFMRPAKIRASRRFHTAGVLDVRRGWGTEETRGDCVVSRVAVARFMKYPG